MNTQEACVKFCLKIISRWKIKFRKPQGGGNIFDSHCTFYFECELCRSVIACFVWCLRAFVQRCGHKGTDEGVGVSVAGQHAWGCGFEGQQTNTKNTNKRGAYTDAKCKPPPQPYISRVQEFLFFAAEKTHGTPSMAAVTRQRRQTNEWTDRQTN